MRLAVVIRVFMQNRHPGDDEPVKQHTPSVTIKTEVMISIKLGKIALVRGAGAS